MKIDITKGKIKKATIELMEKCSSPSEVTSRAIAKEAGVQLAMINYCFGSREALLFSVFMDMSKSNFEQNPQIFAILKSDIKPKEKLRQMHYMIAGFLIDEFAYTQAVTGFVLLNRDLSQGLNSLPFVIEHYGNRKTKQECKIISYELSSVMQLAINRHKALKEFCGIDLTSRKELEKFVDLQIDIFLKD